MKKRDKKLKPTVKKRCRYDFIVKIIILCKRFLKKTSPFYSLTPTDNAEGVEKYIEALNWALENKHKIKNIAISGSYGSGKSSVIHTFIKRSQNSNLFLRYWRKAFPKHRFLNISLATFKDESGKALEESEKSEQLRLIELSVLQQLVFREKSSRLLDSRLLKIKHKTKFRLFVDIFLIFSFIFSCVYLFKLDFFEKYFFTIPEDFKISLKYIALAFFFIGVLLLLYKFSRILIGLSIKTINWGEAKIEIDDKINKSILNHHLEEIIYFFEATKYNVVIIEDLDRFEQSEVFIKLREINNLVNSSNKIKRDVVFVYAIKDDMFKDKDRTKFFDFMIPIIPIINYSNSEAKLQKAVRNNRYKISANLIEDLSVFIDDMRLLNNILNEYEIYSNLLAENLIPDSLLAMIIYKNLYPNDFTALSKKEGKLYKTISSKREYIIDEKKKLDDEILVLQKRIEELDEVAIKSIAELRMLYLLKIIEKIPQNYGFLHFMINNKKVSFSNICNSEENFKFIQNGRVDYQWTNRNYGQNESNLSFNFKDIEKEINLQITYEERENSILSSNNNLKQEIEKLERYKDSIQKFNLKELTKFGKIELDIEDENQKTLIASLLRNGYIDDNYIHYISIFHEGFLTKEDNQFYLNVKKDTVTDFDFYLINTDNVISKLNESDFEKECILNFALLEALLTNDNHSTKRDLFLEQLSNEKPNSIQFIDRFIEHSGKVDIFILHISKNWTNIWNFIEEKSNFSNERKEKYFKLLIAHTEINSLRSIFKDNKNYINSYSKFLKLPYEQINLKNIIQHLNLKFLNLDSDSPTELLNFVLKGDYYAINVDMLKLFLSINNISISDSFKKANFGCILLSELPQMISYIEQNIDEYVAEVYLEIETNNEEKEEDYIALLNKENLNLELKGLIIKQVNTIVKSSKDIANDKVCENLFLCSRISPKWENVLDIYNRTEKLLAPSLIVYLNSLSNFEILSKEKMTTEKNEDGVQEYMNLCKSLIHSTEIKLEAFRAITKSIPWWYSSFETEKISKEKMHILIENTVVNPNVESFKYLKENYPNLQITLVERFTDKFIEIIEHLEIDNEDLSIILISTHISNSNKLIFINSVEDEIILENEDSIKKVAKLIIQGNFVDKIRESLLFELIKNENLTVDERIKVFDKAIKQGEIAVDIINKFLLCLGGEYANIVNKSESFLVVNIENELLLNNLKKLNYIEKYTKTKKGFRVYHKE